MRLNLNDEKFVNSIVYHNMAYCFNHACPKANTCFRHIAAKMKKPDMKYGNTIFPDALQDGKCEFFIRPRIIKAAWGFHSLFDKVRHQDVDSVRCWTMGILGGKTSYYRYHRGEKLLTPEQQEAINELFEEKGYSKPSFDHYKESIDFTDKEVSNSFTE